MKVHFKKLVQEAQKPKFGKPGDAGADLVATTMSNHDDHLVYGVGLAVEIPEGMVGLVFPRSSIRQTDLFMANSVEPLTASIATLYNMSFKIITIIQL